MGGDKVNRHRRFLIFGGRARAPCDLGIIEVSHCWCSMHAAVTCQSFQQTSLRNETLWVLFSENYTGWIHGWRIAEHRQFEWLWNDSSTTETATHKKQTGVFLIPCKTQWHAYLENLQFTFSSNFTNFLFFCKSRFKIQSFVSNGGSSRLSLKKFVLISCKPIRPLTYCLSSVTQFIFLNSRHARKGFITVIWNKDTVPAKALLLVNV